MTVSINQTEVAHRLPELLARVSHREERYLIEQQGIPIAALVSTEDLTDLEHRPGPDQPGGLQACVGALAEIENLDDIVAEILVVRRDSHDREVSLE